MSFFRDIPEPQLTNLEQQLLHQVTNSYRLQLINFGRLVALSLAPITVYLAFHASTAVMLCSFWFFALFLLMNVTLYIKPDLSLSMIHDVYLINILLACLLSDYLSGGSLHITSLSWMLVLTSQISLPFKGALQKMHLDFFLVLVYHGVRSSYEHDDQFYQFYARGTNPQYVQIMLRVIFNFLCPILTCAYALAAAKLFRTAASTQVLVSEGKAVDAVIQSSEAKSNFTNYLSHEVRNCLNVILSLTENTLNRGRWMESETVPVEREVLEDILSAVEMASRIVSDVLCLEKMEQGELPMFMELFNCSQMFSSSLRRFLPDVETKNLTININNQHMWHSIESSEIVVIGDKSRIEQIVNNFLSNAIKFTDHNGFINLNWSLEEAENETFLNFGVIDSGAGISKNDQHKLFKKFSQLRAGELQAGGGSGLGLAICKEIALLHDGMVGCESEGRGKGSRFWCRVSVTSDPSKTPRTMKKELDNECEDVSNNHPPKSRETSERVNDDHVLAQVGQLNVLIVDDQKMNVKLLQRTIESLGVSKSNIVCCFDGKEAVDAVAKKDLKFDLVLLDHEMPRMTGSQAATVMRSNLGFKGRIIGVTGNAGTQQKEQFIASGADAVIVKPYKRNEISAALVQYVKCVG